MRFDVHIQLSRDQVRNSTSSNKIYFLYFGKSERLKKRSQKNKMNCETRKRGTLCGKEECEPCFVRSFASIENSKYMVEGQENPLLVSKSSAKKLEFVCPKCTHNFEMRPNDISSGYFCPFCSNQKLCTSGECGMCFEKSFANREKAKYWSTEKNNLTPREVFASSGKKYWFRCGKCGHYFETSLNNVSRGTFCPFCPNKKLCSSDDCKACFEKSFASHKKARYWSTEKNKKTPREMFVSSNKKFWFECGNCGHSFEAKLSNISNGTFCPYCSNGKLCSSNECKMCFGKSFASHKKAEFWDNERNRGSPRDIFLGSEKKCWFECEKKHKFSGIPYRLSSGQWCPKCKNKSEAKVLSFLEENFRNTIHQFRVPWCKNPETGKCLPFDFCVSKTIIELDGEQHYKQVSNWKSPEEYQKRDRYKEECAIKNGYSVIRILQKDVWNEEKEWRRLLLAHVKDHETPAVRVLWEGEPYRE
ncbi:restriction endonuclease [Brazilian marseillevirus]|uniref:restriction endonuclease n=1 Tax=Brazilian marseillevirus TaxID=1813599 RepID=UPI0007862D10|nr:restriction endonuclease [Brazilian marseillevirus]AMQ10950.1 restriction endonuclease [Brazilian marseillevirus]